MTFKQLRPAFAVLLLPLFVIGLANWTGYVLFSEQTLDGLRPWCLIPIEGLTSGDRPTSPRDASCDKAAEARNVPAQQKEGAAATGSSTVSEAPANRPD